MSTKQNFVLYNHFCTGYFFVYLTWPPIFKSWLRRWRLGRHGFVAVTAVCNYTSFGGKKIRQQKKNPLPNTDRTSDEALFLIQNALINTLLGTNAIVYHV